MDKQLQEIMQTAQADQAITGTRNFAAIVATYYQALREQGIDETHAYLLAQDYQRMQLRKALWPDVPPLTED